MSDDVVRAEGVRILDRDGRVLVDGVDLCVPAGARVGVVGESGAGKTLFARACLGLLPEGVHMAAGKVSLLGQDPMACGAAQLRGLLGRHVGYVPQNSVSYLHPGLKVLAQITDGYRTWHKVSRVEAKERAVELLCAVGIADAARVLESYPGQLSGGMRQRVNIAMALMSSPELVVADEPTAALDAVTRTQVASLLQRVCAERGAALLMVSHDLPLVRRTCNSAIVMRKGRVVERGQAARVLAHPSHPYTQALLSAVPHVGMPRDVRLPEYDEAEAVSEPRGEGR